MVDPSPPTPDRDTLAAELALGLLEGTDRVEALRLCLSDPAFAAAVETWSLRLSPLLHAIPPVQPPEHIWKAVEARTGIGLSRDVSNIHSLRLWRGGALVCGAIAASLALFIAVRPSDLNAPAPMAVSQLVGAQGPAIMAIAFDARQGVLRLSTTSLPTGDKSPELWVIPEDGVPRSLGIIGTEGQELTVDPAHAKFLKSGVTLAITMEDTASAPHKAPSSQPVLTGKITVI
ncbi:anti-sigma factor [Sphingobium subterraneum]|uniref:Anti-sigma-K factor RskA n=1 Tax=Sphingobium subterraneum TaxID=627688 RepID=A0A841J161_9SPHN|nr:anti-sigma factor [Sphingobium subterraneum]MBB6124919.1 anti-sigma-K factor RskA [Sphingobium subterraneum]